MSKSSLLLATALAAGLGQSAAAHETVLRGRLVFADHREPVLRILDLDTGEVTHRFDVPKPNPTLHAVDGGRYVGVVTGDEAGSVRLLDAGIHRESHGDHFDVEKREPRLVDLVLTGDRPAHLISGQGRLAVFYDGHRPWERPSKAQAVLVDVASLDGTPKIATWTSPAPQHGLAVPLGGERWLLTAPNPAYAKGDDKTASSRPNTIERVDGGAAWTVRASFSCPALHGHGEQGAIHALGCADGVLVVKTDGKPEGEARRLAYPDGRVTSTIASSGKGVMVGNYAKSGPATAFLRIDPAAERLGAADIHEIADGQQACQFAMAPDGASLVHLSPDGKLRLYEVVPQWRQVAVFDAVAPFDCAFGAPTPTPRLAIQGNSAFVSDPTQGRIREFYLATRQQGLDYPVGGMPAKIAAD